MEAARALQRSRYQNDGISYNAQLSNKQIRKYCALDQQGEALVKQAFTALKLSARAYNRILKVARTIADLDHQDRILDYHIAEAIQYRTLDDTFYEEA